MATRATRTGTFGDVLPIPGVNTPSTERGPSVTQDGLVLYAMVSPGTVGAYDVYVATRGTTSASFGSLVAATINSTAQDTDPYVLPDHKALYFASDRDGDYDLYWADRTSGSFGSSQQVGGIDLASNAADIAPVVTPDQLTLYFASERAQVGNFEIYVARRTTIGDGFGAPTVVTELNSAAHDFPTWVSEDGCVLYFTSQRLPDGGAGSGTRDIYVATRGQ